MRIDFAATSHLDRTIFSEYFRMSEDLKGPQARVVWTDYPDQGFVQWDDHIIPLKDITETTQHGPGWDWLDILRSSTDVAGIFIFSYITADTANQLLASEAVNVVQLALIFCASIVVWSSFKRLVTEIQSHQAKYAKILYFRYPEPRLDLSINTRGTSLKDAQTCKQFLECIKYAQDSQERQTRLRAAVAADGASETPETNPDTAGQREGYAKLNDMLKAIPD